MSLFKRRSNSTCSHCKSGISRKAPVSPLAGLEIGQKFARGEISRGEVENWYKSVGANCPSCGRMSCAFCFDKSGKKCPNCGSTIKFFS